MKSPDLEHKSSLPQVEIIEIGEKHSLNDLLGKDYPTNSPRGNLPVKIFQLNGFSRKLGGHIFLDEHCTLPFNSNYKYPLQVESPTAISYINYKDYGDDRGFKWNLLFPFGIPLNKGNIAELSSIMGQFREVNTRVYFRNPAPDRIIMPAADGIKRIYFPLGIELSVEGKSYSSAGWIRESEDSGSDYYVDYQQNWGQPRTYMYFPRDQSLENVIVKFLKLPKSRLYDEQEARAW